MPWVVTGHACEGLHCLGLLCWEDLLWMSPLHEIGSWMGKKSGSRDWGVTWARAFFVLFFLGIILRKRLTCPDKSKNESTESPKAVSCNNFMFVHHLQYHREIHYWEIKNECEKLFIPLNPVIWTSSISGCCHVT